MKVTMVGIQRKPIPTQDCHRLEAWHETMQKSTHHWSGLMQFQISPWKMQLKKNFFFQITMIIRDYNYEKYFFKFYSCHYLYHSPTPITPPPNLEKCIYLEKFYKSPHFRCQGLQACKILLHIHNPQCFWKFFSPKNALVSCKGMLLLHDKARHPPTPPHTLSKSLKKRLWY